MEMPRWASRLLRVGKVLLGGSVVGALATFGKVPLGIVWIFQHVILEPLKPAQSLELSSAGYFIIVMTLVVIACFGFWIYERWEKKPDGLSELGRLHDAISTRGPEYQVHDVSMKIEILKDLTVRSSSEYTVEAVGSDLYVLASTRGSSDVPCADIDAVGFVAENVQGVGGVVTVVAADDPHEKRYLVFFDPPLKPGQQLRIRTSFTWPRSGRKTLSANDWDRNAWTWPPKCKKAVNNVTLTVVYPEDGRRYETVATPDPAGGPKETPTSWTGSFPNVAPGTGIALRTRRTRVT